jgi:ABC-2 type transport system ATP-binding protein
MTTTTAATVIPLAVEGAEKRFGDVRALAGASLDVRPGELVGLLGPNGAGKTTMIRAIAGRLRLDAGTIRLFGRTLAARDPRPEVGVVPQEMAVYPLLTARENLEVFGSLYGVPRSALASRVDWALTWADLKDRAREPVKRFSGGMRRRLNIACGLLHAPKIVLLDEPTAGVDPQSRERIYEMLTELQRSGVSIVLTTHHLEEAEQRCERIVIIDRGKIVAAGTLSDLVTTTLHASRTIKMQLASAWPPAAVLPQGASLDADRRTLTAPVVDVGVDLSVLLARVADGGARVTDVDVAGASLQDVFIALTGRELRD